MQINNGEERSGDQTKRNKEEFSLEFNVFLLEKQRRRRRGTTSREKFRLSAAQFGDPGNYCDIVLCCVITKLTGMDCNPVRRKDPTDLMVSSRQKIEIGGPWSC